MRFIADKFPKASPSVKAALFVAGHLLVGAIAMIVFFAIVRWLGGEVWRYAGYLLAVAFVYGLIHHWWDMVRNQFIREAAEKDDAVG